MQPRRTSDTWRSEARRGTVSTTAAHSARPACTFCMLSKNPELPRPAGTNAAWHEMTGPTLGWEGMPPSAVWRRGASLSWTSRRCSQFSRSSTARLTVPSRRSCARQDGARHGCGGRERGMQGAPQRGLSAVQGRLWAGVPEHGARHAQRTACAGWHWQKTGRAGFGQWGSRQRRGRRLCARPCRPQIAAPRARRQVVASISREQCLASTVPFLGQTCPNTSPEVPGAARYSLRRTPLQRPSAHHKATASGCPELAEGGAGQQNLPQHAAARHAACAEKRWKVGLRRWPLAAGQAAGANQ